MAGLLVTGFGAFPGVASNPSGELIARLQASPPVPGVVAALLPVTWSMLAKELPALHAAHRPQAVIHFGVAARRRMICIEARARNAAAGIDAAGAPCPAHQLDAAGPPSRPVRLDVAALVAAVAAAGVPVRASRDAGTYLCNATLWTSLTAGYPAVFVHLPQAGARGGVSLDAMESAARALIAAVVRGNQSRRCRADRR